MRGHIWIHDETGEIFYRQSEYLEYMRKRMVDRQSRARLLKLRAAALQRLRAIYAVNRFHEIEEFLNDNKNDIEMACRTRNGGMSLLVTPITISHVTENNPDYWDVRVSYGYDYKPRRGVHLSQIHDGDCGEQVMITDVLEALGFKMRGGGGHTSKLSYRMSINKSLFPSATVMEIIAGPY